MHASSTPALTLFTCHGKRGFEAVDDAGVMPAFAGVAVHDGWTPYRTYPDLTHALCNAHHLRELDAVATVAGQADWAEAMARRLAEINSTVDRARRDGATGLHPHLLAAYHRRYDQLIQAAGRPTQTAHRVSAASAPRRSTCSTGSTRRAGWDGTRAAAAGGETRPSRAV